MATVKSDLMLGLEYLMCFGVPSNKLELIRGRSRVALPFLHREQSEAHFADWLDTLCRWKGMERPDIDRANPKRWKARCGDFKMELFPLPVNLNVPLDGKTFLAFHSTAWQREFWDGQPPGLETGWDHFINDGDVRMQLFGLFRELQSQYGGTHCGRVEVFLTERSVVAPDHVYYRRPRAECLVADQYFQGAPDVIAEVMIPATRAIDRGQRMELYGRAGVPHFWLLDPELETLEVFELTSGTYRLVAVYRCGDRFRPALFPDTDVDVARLFDTQLKHHGEPRSTKEPEPIAEWLIPAEQRLGLEHLFLLGHPDRRWEIWNNHVPNVLAFGSPREAEVRMRQFVEEAARWDGMPAPALSQLNKDAESCEIGRFRLARRGRLVSMDVAVDARTYRKVADVYANNNAWDWGE